MKPVELVERAIKNSSKSRDTILDPFGGSGTTLIACEKTGRQARMIELEPKYYDVIVRRWAEFTGEEATLDSETVRPSQRLGVALGCRFGVVQRRERGYSENEEDHLMLLGVLRTSFVGAMLATNSYLVGQQEISVSTPNGTRHSMVFVPEGTFVMGFTTKQEAWVRGGTRPSADGTLWGAEKFRHVQDQKPAHTVNLKGFHNRQIRSDQSTIRCV